MNIKLSLHCCLALSTIFLVFGCSTAKLEARLEANPQCKDVINPKTGALMPCPGSDKVFYREAGLAPVKSVPANTTLTVSTPVMVSTPAAAQASTSLPMAAAIPTNSVSVQADCKAQIHKKTGATLPCPAPD
jgi:hypothetical protein